MATQKTQYRSINIGQYLIIYQFRSIQQDESMVSFIKSVISEVKTPESILHVAVDFVFQSTSPQKMTRRVANPWQGQTCNRNCCAHCPTGNHVAARLHLSTRSVKTAISYLVPRCKISWQTESGQLSPKDRTWGGV